MLLSQILRGMNFQRNLNTHKPETMIVFKKAATRQTKEAHPTYKPHWVGVAALKFLQDTCK